MVAHSLVPGEEPSLGNFLIMVAEKGQPHPLSAHVKPPAVVLLTARGNQYAARGLWKLLGLSRSYLPRAAKR